MKFSSNCIIDQKWFDFLKSFQYFTNVDWNSIVICVLQIETFEKCQCISSCFYFLKRFRRSRSWLHEKNNQNFICVERHLCLLIWRKTTSSKKFQKRRKKKFHRDNKQNKRDECCFDLLIDKKIFWNQFFQQKKCFKFMCCLQFWFRIYLYFNQMIWFTT